MAALDLGATLGQMHQEHRELARRAGAFLARTEPGQMVHQVEQAGPVQIEQTQALPANRFSRQQADVQISPAAWEAEYQAGLAWIESRKPAMRRRADEALAEAELENCTGMCEPSRRCYITGT